MKPSKAHAVSYGGVGFLAKTKLGIELVPAIVQFS